MISSDLTRQIRENVRNAKLGATQYFFGPEDSTKNYQDLLDFVKTYGVTQANLDPNPFQEARNQQLLRYLDLARQGIHSVTREKEKGIYFASPEPFKKANTRDINLAYDSLVSIDSHSSRSMVVNNFYRDKGFYVLWSPNNYQGDDIYRLMYKEEPSVFIELGGNTWIANNISNVSLPKLLSEVWSKRFLMSRNDKSSQ